MVHVFGQLVIVVLAFYKISHPDVEVRRSNFQFVAGQNKDPLENMLQFPNVARPTRLKKKVMSCAVEPFFRDANIRTEFAQKMIGQRLRLRGDRATPVPRWGKRPCGRISLRESVWREPTQPNEHW